MIQYYIFVVKITLTFCDSDTCHYNFIYEMNENWRFEIVFQPPLAIYGIPGLRECARAFVVKFSLNWFVYAREHWSRSRKYYGA